MPNSAASAYHASQAPRRDPAGAELPAELSFRPPGILQLEPPVDGTRLDAYVAGDDAGAKQKALEFAESIGFRPVDAGPLAMARALEAMAMLNILLQIQNNWPWQSGWKLAGPTGGDE